MQQIVVSVGQLNRYLKAVMDADENLNDLYIRGEISNFTNHIRSGHYYMTLKDSEGALRAVMFRQNNNRLRFLPEDGMRVLARGRVSVYERDGQYQLYITDMQPDGLGELHLAYEQLKQRLETEGLFAPERKQPIPHFPQRIAVIMSPTGAVFHDICNVLKRRFPSVQVLLCPVEVQGEHAAGQIAAMLQRVNAQGAADVIIVGRGGGSLEDLWAFNEEAVARAVAQSGIPVISAVGHETDYTICDFASDLRAPTPSAAAELAVPDQTEVKMTILGFRQRGRIALSTLLQQNRLQLQAIHQRFAYVHPGSLLAQKRQTLDTLTDQLRRTVLQTITRQHNRLTVGCGKLDAISPIKTLSRGYAAVYRENQPIQSAKQLQEGETIALHFAESRAECRVERITNE